MVLMKSLVEQQYDGREMLAGVEFRAESGIASVLVMLGRAEVLKDEGEPPKPRQRRTYRTRNVRK